MSSESLTTVDVLIIDDNPAVRAVMVKYLKQAGYAVDAVSDGMEALDALGTRRYRAIICDLVMPFVNGREFYEQVRAQAPDQAERVLFVTGAEQVPDQRFLALSGRPVLQKPYELRELVTIVAELVGRPPAPGTALT